MLNVHLLRLHAVEQKMTCIVLGHKSECISGGVVAQQSERTFFCLNDMIYARETLRGSMSI